MPQMYLYNTGQADTCPECAQWDGQTGTEEELPRTPNPDCLNGSCNCYLEEIDDLPSECEQQGLEDCIDSEGFEFCGSDGDEGCGEDGCWCWDGLDGQTGNETECDNPYWDPYCACADECPDRDEEGE